jgi:hypothetical protein
MRCHLARRKHTLAPRRARLPIISPGTESAGSMSFFFSTCIYTATSVPGAWQCAQGMMRPETHKREGAVFRERTWQCWYRAAYTAEHASDEGDASCIRTHPHPRDTQLHRCVRVRRHSRQSCLRSPRQHRTTWWHRLKSSANPGAPCADNHCAGQTHLRKEGLQRLPCQLEIGAICPDVLRRLRIADDLDAQRHHVQSRELVLLDPLGSIPLANLERRQHRGRRPSAGQGQKPRAPGRRQPDGAAPRGPASADRNTSPPATLCFLQLHPHNDDTKCHKEEAYKGRGPNTGILTTRALKLLGDEEIFCSAFSTNIQFSELFSTSKT